MALENPFHDDVHKWTYDGGRMAKTMGRAIWEPVALKYRMAIRSARRFTLSDDALETITKASTRLDRMPLWIKLAKIPFETLWIEWDNSARGRAIIRHTAIVEGSKGVEKSDPRVGMLLRRDAKTASKWTATEFVAMDDGDVRPLPFQYVLDTEADEANPVTGADGRRSLQSEYPDVLKGIEAMLMGLRSQDDPHNEHRIISPPWLGPRIGLLAEPAWHANNLNESKRAKAIDPTGRTWLEHRSKISRIVENLIVKRAGSLRHLITTLAMINEVPMAHVDVAARNGGHVIKGRNVPFLSHQVVSIAIPKARQMAAITRMLTDAYKKRRAHEVRGHWRRTTREAFLGGDVIDVDMRTNKKAVILGDDGVARIWIDSHVRGDASLGWVSKSYEVEASASAE